uniref:AlNc14C24G2395 protein n=1 Tax=Albugo laibachii Nc14 TaxID=890382 RepID=F0W695_9STRA|nr:AlNc14C24G2395 [Albugo laibachii Nc14]|eukprot:CCA16638.1 AlNc14C24G2395 [Albugo laibachii Nc14]
MTGGDEILAWGITTVLWAATSNEANIFEERLTDSVCITRPSPNLFILQFIRINRGLQYKRNEKFNKPALNSLWHSVIIAAAISLNNHFRPIYHTEIKYRKMGQQFHFP